MSKILIVEDEADVVMPEKDGFQLYKELRAKPATKDIPVIFLSAILGKSEEKMGGNMIGGNLIFAKPYDFDALVKKINELI